ATGSHSKRRAISVGYYISFVGLGLVAASLGPTLPGLAAHTNTQLSAISILFTARSLGYLGGATVAGWLYDRQAGHPIVATAVLALAVLMACVPFVPLLWLLVGVVLLIGLAEGTMDVGVNTLLVWLHHADVGPAMNALHFFFGLGAFLSPLIVAQVALYSDGINWAYWIIALLLIPVAGWLMRLPSPSNVNADTTAEPVAIDRWLTGLLILFLFLYVGTEVGFSGWIYTYAIEQTQFTAAQAAYLNSGFWGAFTFGRLLSIPLAAGLRPRYLLLGELLLAIVCVGLILLWPTSPVVLWIGVCGAGLAICALFPITLTWAGRHMKLTGRITSWFFTGASIGAMFFPWFIGQFFENRGPQITMVTVMGCLVLDLIIFVILMIYAGQPKFAGNEV
ncbi:MAG: MFS transporter, partial [Caldilineaceae bacterium]|nr:MFS transporter [Caldilineaceae bacterium]